MSLGGTFGLSFFLSFFFTLWAQAQTGYSLKAKASGEYPYVYQSPDFNAPILTELERGKVYLLSSKKIANYFYKVFVKPGLEGYVSDVEIEVQGGSAPGVNSTTLKTQNKKKLATSKKQNQSGKSKPNGSSRPFYAQKYRGLSLESIQYTEDTMGKVRTAPLTFIGFRMSGYDTLVSGEMSTDTNILLYLNAPNYYKSVTGNEAKGWILHSSYTYDTYLKRSTNFLLSYGFGPMFRFSHLVTTLKKPNSNLTVDYPMDDMALGIVLRIGAAFRFQKISLRSDIKYYWEKQRYLALNLGTLYEF